MWRQGSSRETVIQGDAKAFRLGIPLRKIATPDDIVESILFLLSDRAGHITLHDPARGRRCHARSVTPHESQT